MHLFHKYPNAGAAVINLLKKLRVKVSPQDVIEELERHPDYPSLLAVSDVLNWFQIENNAYHIDADQLTQVPAPFIAYINQKDFVLVTRLSELIVNFSDEKSNNRSVSTDEFKKRFKGVVLTAEAPDEKENTGNESFPDKLMPFKMPAAFLMLGVSFLFTLIFHSHLFSHIIWQSVLLTAFKTAGLITSILLLVQSIDKNNPLVQTLCGGGGQTNCNAILTSKAAVVFKGLSWSEVGFFYFAGTWLVLLFGGGSTVVISCLAVLNLISLPYTVYSINYQARVAKQWCLLCTTVQAILWLEFIPFLSFLKQGITVPDFSQLTTILILLVLPVATWMLLKPLLLSSQQLKGLKYQLRSYKYSRELFGASLKKQPKYVLPSEDWSIVLGNVEANTIITMVSNPYCPPCSKTHQILCEWLNKIPDIQLRIVFTANNREDDFKTPVTRHLMALNQLADKAIIKNALQDWYEQKQKNYEAWANVYPVDLDETKFSQLEKQRHWCDMAEIKATPTILVNGYRIPDGYYLQDIKYMLDSGN